MAKLQNFKNGISLIETTIILAIVAMLAGLAGFSHLDNYRASSFRGDRDLLISLLQHARAESIANVCHGETCTEGESHGVAIRPEDNSGKYVVFQTSESLSDYAHRDVNFDLSFEANVNTSISGDIREVTFEKHSSLVLNPGNIILTDTSGQTSIITINSEGQISWTH